MILYFPYGTYFGLLAGVIWIVLQNYSLNYAATSNMIHIIHSCSASGTLL